jgi:hypothetical protein
MIPPSLIIPPHNCPIHREDRCHGDRHIFFIETWLLGKVPTAKYVSPLGERQKVAVPENGKSLPANVLCYDRIRNTLPSYKKKSTYYGNFVDMKMLFDSMMYFALRMSCSLLPNWVEGETYSIS